MKDITKIYENTIGLSFVWNDTRTFLTQLVFRDTGFHLTVDEIEIFIEKIYDSKMQTQCSTCEYGDNCRSILLQTPSNKVSLAVSKIELGQIEDLLKGTLFQLKLNDYLYEVCKN